MTLQELIDLLTELRDQTGGDAVVRSEVRNDYDVLSSYTIDAVSVEKRNVNGTDETYVAIIS